MLKAAGNELFFYSNYDKEEAENRMQVDFLVQKEVVTSRHNISPIEVNERHGLHADVDQQVASRNLKST
jgi:hypothetical protein